MFVLNLISIWIIPNFLIKYIYQYITNFILTKINFIRLFNAATLHVALSIDIGNWLLNQYILHKLMIKVYEREYVSFFKGVGFLLSPIASLHQRRSIVRKTPGTPYQRLPSLFCLVLLWLWWLNRQGLCGRETGTKNGLSDPDRNHPLTPAPSHRDLVRGGPLLRVVQDHWPASNFLKFEQVF